jgi:DNA-binding response OmpR family regulator
MAEMRSPQSPGKPAEVKPILKVLVVDPKPQSRSILKGSLRSLEIVQTVLERGGAAGLTDLLVESPVHLILLESELGNDNAFDVIRTIKAHPAGQRTRFVLMGQELSEATRRKGAELGVRGYLTRPFDLQSLEKVMREAVGLPAPGESAQIKELKETLDKLRKIAVFSEFTDQELVRLLRICNNRNIPAGEYAFREGDKGDRLYVLVSGQVDIKQRRGTEEKILVTMRPGDCFGEVAIIDSNPRTADAQAAVDTMVIEVREETVSRDNDLIALKLVRQIAILLAKKLRAQSK